MENKQSDNPAGYTLSEQEKDAMRLAIEAHMKALPPGLIKSPWMHLFSIPTFAALVALFLCASTSYASYGATPGDILYPIKVHVIEPVRLLVAVTPEAEIRTQIEIAKARVEEARILEERKALDEATARELQERFEIHVKAARARQEDSNVAAEVAFDVTPFQVYTSMIERAAHAFKDAGETTPAHATSSLSKKVRPSVSATTSPDKTEHSLTASSSKNVASTTLLQTVNATSSTFIDDLKAINSVDEKHGQETSSPASSGDEKDTSGSGNSSSVAESVKDTVHNVVPAVSLPALH